MPPEDSAKETPLTLLHHDLRTPLAAVVGLAQVLEEEVHDPRLRPLVCLLRESSDRLRGEVEHLLDHVDDDAAERLARRAA